MRKWLLVACAVLAMGMPVRAEEAQGNGGEVKTAQEVKTDLKTQIRKLRGKVLYKKNQISRLEKQAKAADPAVKAKADQLEAQRRELFFGANPNLKPLYAEMEAFQAEIEKLVQKNAGISVEADKD